MYIRRLVAVILCLTLGSIAHGATWYVDRDAAEGGDGTSWGSAYREIQPAIDAAHADGGGEVWVAEGVYDEERPENGGSLAMREGVHLYGGFSGAEAILEERGDSSEHHTAIAGTKSWDGVSKGIVVIGANQCTLDGFIIGGRNAGGLSLGHVSNAIVRNSEFIGGEGYASTVNVSGSSEVSIDRCRFENNPHYSLYAEGARRLVVAHSEFSNSGACAYVDSEALFEDCTFSDATQGAVLLYGIGGATTFRGCIFKENRGKVRGTAVYIYGGDGYQQFPALFTNCVFAFNGPNDTPPEEQTDFYSTVYLDAYHDYKSLVAPKRHALQGAPAITDRGEGEGDDFDHPEPGYDVEEPSFFNCTFYGNRVKYGALSITRQTSWSR